MTLVFRGVARWSTPLQREAAVFKRVRTTFGALVAVGAVAAALAGAPPASAWSNQYAHDVSMYGGSAWVLGDYEDLYSNSARVSGAICVTAINEIGGGEAGTAVCDYGGDNVTIGKVYCPCQGRTAAVKPLGTSYIFTATDAF